MKYGINVVFDKQKIRHLEDLAHLRFAVVVHCELTTLSTLVLVLPPAVQPAAK